MIYVITGATSFIGLELIRFLNFSGEEVIAICRKNSNKQVDIPCGVRIVHASMEEYDELHKFINKADIFINLAWEGTGHLGRNLTNIQQDNVKNTLAAMSSAKKMGCKLFLESGSQAEYGTINTIIKEDTECHPFSEYGKAKLEVLKKGQLLSQELGLKYVHLRIFSIYGENDHPWTLFSTCIKKMKNDEDISLSDCTQYWNFLYVKDAVSLIYKLIKEVISDKQHQCEIYNLASNDTRVLKDFVLEMKNTTSSNSKLKFGEINVSNRVNLQPSIEKLLKVIGNFEFTPFHKIIKNTYDR